MKQPILVALILCLAGYRSFAQSIVNAELNATPMTVNPAFTGMFTGAMSVNSFYANHWAGTDLNYVSYGASVDLPLVTGKGGSYLAAGMQLRKDEAGDGNLSNFSGLMSVAYHKIFRKANDSNNAHAADLAVGIQGGYEQSTINLSRIFLGSPLANPMWTYLPPPGQSIEYGLGIGNSANYYAINAGISFVKSFSERIKFIAGFSVNNLNRPTIDLGLKYYYDLSGLDLQCVGTVAATVLISKRFSLQPAAFYMNSANSRGLVAGNDFTYKLSKNPKAGQTTSVFLGLWYRSGDVVMATVGVIRNRLHLGIAYDYMPQTIRTSGNGGLCVNFRYIAPGKGNKRMIPCDRF